MALAISDAAGAAGLSTHTLRYYERAGLLRPVARASSGHRRYDQRDLDWLDFLTKLRMTGMPVREIRRYTELVWAGDHTEPERLAMLTAHREQVRAQLDDMQRCLERIDFKVNLYRERITTT
jgi:DNA-binding transcriptional MerR regulator